MSPETIKAGLALLNQSTRGSYDFWRLMGKYNSGLRQQIMSATFGFKVPKAKCGVTEMRAVFYEIAKPEGLCLAAREQAFTEWANNYLIS